MFDIVFPNNNEQEFFAMAQRLGWKGLVLVYAPGKLPKQEFQSPLPVRHGVVVEPEKAGVFRKKGMLTFVKCSEHDRQVLEQGAASVLFGAESTQPKDYIHQRGSGLNQVLCALAKKNNVAIGLCLSDVISAQDALRAQLMGRMMQNIVLCRKYKVKMLAGSFATSPWQMRSPHDTQSFLTVLGMHPAEAKTALQQF